MKDDPLYLDNKVTTRTFQLKRSRLIYYLDNKDTTRTFQLKRSRFNVLGTSHFLPGGVGAGYIQGGGGIFLCDILGGGGENKKPLGQKGHIFHQVFGGGGGGGGGQMCSIGFCFH